MESNLRMWLLSEELKSSGKKDCYICIQKCCDFQANFMNLDGRGFMVMMHYASCVHHICQRMQKKTAKGLLPISISMSRGLSMYILKF